MSTELRISIQGKNPPSWAVGDQCGTYFSYYENEHGEQWVAKGDDGILRISGLDIDWEEFQLNAEQAVAENNRIVDQIVASKLVQTKGIPESASKSYLETVIARQREYIGRIPLANLVLGQGEMLWLAGVLDAVIPHLKSTNEKQN